MSTLTNIDKLKLEKLFNMSEGYVLDFTNRSFKDFVNTITNINIYSEKYSNLWNSKANRLRSFWNKENDKIVWKLLWDLLEQHKTDKLLSWKEFTKSENNLFEECKKIVIRLSKWNKTEVINKELDYVDYFSYEKILELKKIKTNDFDLLKMIRILEEVNICYTNACYLAISSLLRMFIDHIPPVFWFRSFKEIVSSYKFSKSDKKNMEHLLWAMKNISDWNLHSHISKKEILPLKRTIEFRADFDVLLKNIILILNNN